MDQQDPTARFGVPDQNNKPENQGSHGPQPAERLNNIDFNKESNITRSDTQANPEEGQGEKAYGLQEKAGKAATQVSETVNDVKDVAKAGPTGLESSRQEVGAGYEKGGVKGAVAASGREAAGQAVATGVDIATGGATAKYHGKIAKGVSKALKKENLKKILIGVIAIIAIPATIIGLIIAVMFYAVSNPLKFLEVVLVDDKAREFLTQATALVPKTFLSQEELLKQYGYVEYRGANTVYAQGSAQAPKPGSLAEKMTKINLENAFIQTESARKSCPYRFTTKQMIGPNGQTTSVIDKVFDSKNKEVTSRNSIVYFCLMQNIPLFQIMIRSPLAREVNASGNIHLNYAAPKDSKEINTSPSQLQEYVYNKTYNFITNKPNDVPKLNEVSINDYVTKVREALINGDDPYAVDSNYQFPSDINSEQKQIIETMCAFSNSYLQPENLRKGITSRFNTAQRSGVKWNTLSSTRELGDVANSELGATLKQVENWQASRAYAQNVYGRQTGEPINPESLSNTSYQAYFQQTLALLNDIRDECSTKTSSMASLVKKYVTIFNNYKSLREIIVAESNGKFTSIDDFGVQQLMIGIIRMNGGSAVSGLEPGPQNFNNQSQGIRQLINRYMMRIGGRFLTKEEQAQLAMQNENTRRYLEEKNGMAYRLFDEHNIRSLANIMKFETPRSIQEAKRVGGNYIAALSNPIKTLADFNFSINYYAFGKNNQAFAANALGDAYMKLDTVGLPSSMFEGVDIFQISDEIQEILKNGTDAQKKLLGYFDRCAKSNIPSSAYFIRLAPVDNHGNVDIGQQFVVKPTDSNNYYPYYPVLADQLEGDGELKEDKRAFMACEIYLLPPDPKSNPITTNSQELFGVNNVVELANKYHLYLYSNSIADLLITLSNKENDDSIYANPSGLRGGSLSTVGGGLITGEVKDLAQKIVNNPNISYDYGPGGKIGIQFKQLAAGENPVPCGSINPQLLGMILAIAKNHTIQISSLATGRECRPQSWHGSGGAVDISYFDGQKLTGNNEPSNNLIEAIISVIPSSTKTGFGNCDGHQLSTQGKQVYFFPDNCNHVHTQMEFNTQ